jgi:hypothetical protein
MVRVNRDLSARCPRGNARTRSLHCLHVLVGKAVADTHHRVKELCSVICLIAMGTVPPPRTRWLDFARTGPNIYIPVWYRIISKVRPQQFSDVVGVGSLHHAARTSDRIPVTGWRCMRVAILRREREILTECFPSPHRSNDHSTIQRPVYSRGSPAAVTPCSRRRSASCSFRSMRTW